MSRIMRPLLCVVVLVGGCAGVMRALNDAPPPAAETELGKSAAQHHAEALAAGPSSPRAVVVAAELAAKQCDIETSRLTSISRGGGAFSPLYPADVETLATVRGPRTIAAVSRECIELAHSLHARVAALTAPPPPAPAEVAPELDATAGPAGLAEAQFHHTPAELDELIHKTTAGYHAGPTIAGRLEKLDHMGFPLLRGQCYVLVLTFDDGARIRSTLRAMTIFANKPDYLRPSGSMFGPGAVLDLDCVMKDGMVAVGLRAIDGGRPYNFALERAGQGGFSLTLYDRPLPPSELPARQRVWEEQVKAMSDAMNNNLEEIGRRRRREACDRCAHPYSGDPVQSYDACLQRQGMNRRDCS